MLVPGWTKPSCTYELGIVWWSGVSNRLGGALKHLIDLINPFTESGIGFQRLAEQIETTNAGGKMLSHIFGARAEFEHDVIRERTKAGIAAARAGVLPELVR